MAAIFMKRPMATDLALPSRIKVLFMGQNRRGPEVYTNYKPDLVLQSILGQLTHNIELYEQEKRKDYYGRT